MVNEDILGGIDLAVSRGETLESAMVSFYNSGYSKEDIEWAAKAFQLNQFKKNLVKSSQKPKEGTAKKDEKEGKLEKNKEFEQFVKKPYYAEQKVSSYEQASQFQEKIILVVLVSSLILLLSVLAGVFFFKEKLVDFINTFFVQ